MDVFHAGTAERDGRIVTAGGRVLGVTALGEDRAAARAAAYAAADVIAFDGMQLAAGHRRMSEGEEERGHAVPVPNGPDAVAVADPDVEAEFAGIEVDAPRVGIVMGSKSDMPAMEAAAKELEERGIHHEVRVMSAHRDPEVVADYARNAQMRGLRVIIAGAGLSAALPGVVAAHTRLPVIGVPLDVLPLDRGRAGRAALHRPDAAGRAGGLRRRGFRAQRRGAGGAHPRRVGGAHGGAGPRGSGSAVDVRA